MQGVELIITIVERGKADKCIKAAKNAGATGATIFYGRGTAEHEVKHFLNLNIDSSKEIFFILTEQNKLDAILEAITESGKLDEAGTGIVFTVPVNRLIGLHHREDFEELKHE